VSAIQPVPGQVIWVDFGNRQTFEHPVYLGPVYGAAKSLEISRTQSSAAAFNECAGQLGANGPSGEYTGGLSSIQKYGLENAARQDFGPADLVKVSPDPLKGRRGSIIYYPADYSHADPQMDILLATNSPIAYLIRMVSGFRASTGKYSRHFDSTTTLDGVSFGFAHWASNEEARLARKNSNAIVLLQRLAQVNPEEARIAFGEDYSKIKDTAFLKELNVKGLAFTKWIRDGFYTLARRDWAMKVQVQFWADKILKDAWKKFVELGWTDLRCLAILARARNSAGSYMNSVAKAGQGAKTRGLSEAQQIQAGMDEYSDIKGSPDRVKRIKDIIPEGIKVTEFPDTNALNYGAPIIRNGVKVEKTTSTIITPNSNGSTSIEAPKEGVQDEILTPEDQLLADRINNPSVPEESPPGLFGLVDSAANKLAKLIQRQVPSPAIIASSPCVSTMADASPPHVDEDGSGVAPRTQRYPWRYVYPGSPDIPIQGSSEFKRIYGDFAYKPAGPVGKTRKIIIDKDWRSRHTTSVQVPLSDGKGGIKHKRFEIHRTIAKEFLDLFEQAVRASGYRPARIGGFNPRFMKTDQKKISFHSYGVSFDIDSEFNSKKLSREGRSILRTKPGAMEFVRIFEEAGWEWGGRWSNNFTDDMHFQRTHTRRRKIGS